MRPPGSTHVVTRGRVIEAAVTLFARKGFAATGIRELATESGLSSSSLYEYMETKDDLLTEIMHATIEPLIEAGDAIVHSGEPPEWQLAAIAETHVWFHAVHPRETLVTDTEVRSLHGDGREQVIASRDRYEALWRSIVAAGGRDGVFDVVDRRVAAKSLLGLCTGIATWYEPGGRLTIERLCAAHADMCLAAVRAVRNGRPVRRADLDLPDPQLPLADEV